MLPVLPAVPSAVSAASKRQPNQCGAQGSSRSELKQQADSEQSTGEPLTRNWQTLIILEWATKNCEDKLKMTKYTSNKLRRRGGLAWTSHFDRWRENGRVQRLMVSDHFLKHGYLHNCIIDWLYLENWATCTDINLFDISSWGPWPTVLVIIRPIMSMLYATLSLYATIWASMLCVNN